MSVNPEETRSTPTDTSPLPQDSVPADGTTAPATTAPTDTAAPTDDDKKEGGLGLGNGIGSILGAVLGFMMGNAMGGPMMGVVMALLLGGGGFLAGGEIERRLQDDPNAPPTPEEIQARQQGAGKMLEIAGDDRQVSAEEISRDGRLDTEKLAAVLGSNPDRDNNQQLDRNEIQAVDQRIAQLVETNPEVRDIAASFQNTLRELSGSGRTTADTERQRGDLAQAADGPAR